MEMRCRVAAVLVLAACSHPLVVATAPASTADCPFGGEVVSSGADRNGNGVLDGNEVESSTIVCNDRPAPSILVRLVAEPAGAHCALDGTAVESGPDLNGNGVLDDDEVTNVDYVCGEPLLTRLAAVPPDAKCPAGGVAVLAGRDRNHDGQLEDDEVEQREVTCGDELAGDIVIHDATEAAAITGIAVITGSLTVDSTALSELALPQLTQIRGGFEITGNMALGDIALPALQTVDGALALSFDPVLSRIDLPVLHRVGSLIVIGDTALADLGHLAALTEVVGDIQISNDDALGAVDLTGGAIGGSVTFAANAQLTSISVALPGTLGGLAIGSNPQLASVEVSGTAAGRLTQLAGTGVAINASHALVRIAIDADDIAAFTVADSPVLTDVAVTGVQVSGQVSLVGIGEARLAFSALAPDAYTIAGSFTVSGPVVALTSTRPLVVGRDCTIDLTHLTSFGPDVVSRVTGELTVSNNPLMTSISTIPVGDLLEISGNHALTDLSFQLGDEFFGTLTIENNAALETAPFDGLQRVVGYVTIDSNPALKTFAPALQEVTGALQISRNDSMTDVGLTQLWHAGGLAIDSCNALTKIELPALSLVNIFDVDITSNAQLQHIAFPALQSASFEVLANPRLPACEVTALFALLTGGDHDQRFNDDTAVCTP